MKKIFLYIIILNLSANMSSGILGVYLYEVVGSFLNLGLLLMIPSVIILFADIPLSYIFDRTSHRTSLLLGNICIIIYSILFLFPSITNLVIATIFFGFALSFLSGSLTAIFYESISKVQNKHKLISTFQIITSITIICSILIGYFVYTFDIKYVWIIQSCCVFFVSILNNFLLPKNKHDPQKNKNVNIIFEIWKIYKNNIPMHITHFIFFALLAIISTFYISKFLSKDAIKDFFTTSAVLQIVIIKVFMLLSGIIGLIIVRFNNKTKLYLSTLLFIISLLFFIFYLFNHSLFIFSITIILFLNLSSVISQHFYIFINEKLQNHYRATFFSVSSSIFSILDIGFTPIFGYFIDLDHKSTINLTLFFCFILCVFIMIKYKLFMLKK